MHVMSRDCLPARSLSQPAHSEDRIQLLFILLTRLTCLAQKLSAIMQQKLRPASVVKAVPLEAA